MEPWLPSVLARIHSHARLGQVQLTEKARRESRRLGLVLGADDICEILSALDAQEFHASVVSEVDGDTLYIFKPFVYRTRIYVKIAVREISYLISFHEDDHA